MTSDEFKSWRKEMGFSQAAAALALGISKPTVENYERGFRREDGRPVDIPKSIALACAAIFHRIEEWPGNRELF